MLVRVKKGGRAKHERKTSTYPDLFYFVAFELTFELELTVDLRHQCLVHFFFRVEAVQSQCEVSAFFCSFSKSFIGFLYKMSQKALLG